MHTKTNTLIYTPDDKLSCPNTAELVLLFVSSVTLLFEGDKLLAVGENGVMNTSCFDCCSCCIFVCNSELVLPVAGTGIAITSLIIPCYNTLH